MRFSHSIIKDPATSDGSTAVGKRCELPHLVIARERVELRVRCLAPLRRVRTLERLHNRARLLRCSTEELESLSNEVRVSDCDEDVIACNNEVVTVG